ncbi:MAG: putative porin, partial [Terriglobales bacterium]
MTLVVQAIGQDRPAESSAGSEEVAALRRELAALREQVARQQNAMARIEAELGELREAQRAGNTVQAPGVYSTEPILRPTAQMAAAPSAAPAPQRPQPQRSALESMAERFRFSGDVRVRFEPILQDLAPARYRARVRVRFGVDGKLGEDLSGGLYLATGTVGDDPVSTNFTDSQFF